MLTSRRANTPERDFTPKMFATKLREEMRVCELTTKQLSVMTGIPVDTLNGYICGNGFPILRNLWRIRRSLGCEWGDLLGD